MGMFQLLLRMCHHAILQGAIKMIKVEQQLAGLDLQVMMIVIFQKCKFLMNLCIIEMRTKNSIESKKEITKKKSRIQFSFLSQMIN